MAIDDTLVTTFSDGGSASSGDGIIIELDDELNTYTDDDGLPKVKTSFYPGDEAYFRVNLRNDLTLTEWDSTDGTVTYIGTDTRTIRKQIFFHEEGQTENLGYYIDRIDEDPYWGEYAPDFQLKDNNTLVNNRPEPNIFLLSYTVTFHIFRLTPPNLDDFFPTEDPNPTELDFEDSYPIGIEVTAESA